MTDLDQDMKRLTEGLKTKSDKIRKLGNAGYKRQQIADFLAIRYQHVRNVLIEAEKRAAAIAAQESGFGEGGAPPPVPPLRRSVTTAHVRPDGSVTFPAEVLGFAGFFAKRSHHRSRRGRRAFGTSLWSRGLKTSAENCAA